MKRFVCLLLSALMLTACSVTPSEPTETTADEIKKDKSVVTEIVEKEIDPDSEYVTGNYLKVNNETIQKYPRLTNLPTLYINLDNGLQLGDVQHGVYSTATYTFVDQYLETSYYELPLSIKGRGNYSWSFAQKPYTLKLNESADFLGMGAAKKWILITVSSDKTMLHNYLTQKMALKMGLKGTVENEYVDVVVNGNYSGTYVLTESVQLHDNRIDVPGDEGILFEIEMVYRHSCFCCIEMYENKNDPSNSVHLELKEYKGVDVDELDRRVRTSAQAELVTYFAKVENAMKSGSYQELVKYIDVDSFVNWYLLNEFCRNYDSQFVTSVYCYINEDNKLYMGPCWDYDTCYGIQFYETDGSFILSTAPWYQWLFKNSPDFVKQVCARWTEMRKDGGLIDWFTESIDTTVQTISMSEQMQHTVYPNSEMTNLPYQEAVQYMKDWIKRRLVWMDQQYLLSK